MGDLQIRYALISNNIVESVIVCNDPTILSNYSQYDHIELLDTEEENKFCGVGAHWDSANGRFFYPEIPKKRDITYDDFILKFSKEERIKLYTKENEDMRVKVELQDLKYNPIFFDDPEVIAFMNYLVSISVIDQSRVSEILS